MKLRYFWKLLEDVSAIDDEAEETRSNVTSRIAWEAAIVSESDSDGTDSKADKDGLDPGGVAVALVDYVSDQETEDAGPDNLKT